MIADMISEAVAGFVEGRLDRRHACKENDQPDYKVPQAVAPDASHVERQTVEFMIRALEELGSKDFHINRALGHFQAYQKETP